MTIAGNSSDSTAEGLRQQGVAPLSVMVPSFLVAAAPDVDDVVVVGEAVAARPGLVCGRQGGERDTLTLS